MIREGLNRIFPHDKGDRKSVLTENNALCDLNEWVEWIDARDFPYRIAMTFHKRLSHHITEIILFDWPIGGS